MSSLKGVFFMKSGELSVSVFENVRNYGYNFGKYCNIVRMEI